MESGTTPCLPSRSGQVILARILSSCSVGDHLLSLPSACADTRANPITMAANGGVKWVSTPLGALCAATTGVHLPVWSQASARASQA